MLRDFQHNKRHTIANLCNISFYCIFHVLSNCCLGFFFLVLHWIQISFLKDEIDTKLKLGSRAGIQSRKEGLQEESNKEKREEKREMNPSCAMCYCMLSLQKEMVQ